MLEVFCIHYNSFMHSFNHVFYWTLALCAALFQALEKQLSKKQEDRRLCPWVTFRRFITLEKSGIAFWKTTWHAQLDLNFISVIVWWVFFWCLKSLSCKSNQFFLDRCAGIKVKWVRWLKVFFDPDVLGLSRHVFLEGDTQPQERLISQSLGANILLARGRASTLVSGRCVLSTTVPLEGRRHLLRFWQGRCSVSSPAFVSCLRVSLWSYTFLSTRCFPSRRHDF